MKDTDKPLEPVTEPEKFEPIGPNRTKPVV